MKKISILLTAALCFADSLQIRCQHLDFDSLYKADAEFRKQIASRPAYENIFYNQEVAKITIESDFKSLIKNKYKGEYQPAVFKYYLNDSIVVTREIKIKPRGNMRRRTCYFPPLMLDFPKKEVVLQQMKEFDKLKLVLDCKRGNVFEQYLLSEYYAYKIYNLITDYSFKVRLFELTLIDVNSKMKDFQSFAYLIEKIDQLAERHNAVPFEREHVRDQYTDLATLSNGYLFQYLIGNTDWSIPALHNIKMIKSQDPTQQNPYFIPYDFDYAGIVNTTYAVPDEHLGIESVRERVYRGVCIDEKYLFEAAQRYKDQKDSVYDLYNSSPFIDKGNRNSTIKYLDEFYHLIESDNLFRKHILENCRE